MTTTNADRLKATARSLAARSEFEEAVFAYERVLAMAPEDVDALLDLAYLDVHVVAGHGDGDALWRRALTSAPESMEALFWSAYHDLVDGGAGDARMGARRLRRIIELDPENRSGYVACAHALLGSAIGSDLADAERLAHFQTAVHIAPDAPRFHADLARAYERRGRLREALAHFERALAQSRPWRDWPGDSRERYKADVLEGRFVPRHVLDELRGAVARVRRRLRARGHGR